MIGGQALKNIVSPTPPKDLQQAGGRESRGLEEDPEKR